MTFSSAPPPAPTWEPHDKAMFDKLSPEKRERTWLLMCSFIRRHQGSEHLARVVPELSDPAVWTEPPRSQGFPIDFVPKTDVLPSHDNRASVTLGSPSPFVL